MKLNEIAKLMRIARQYGVLEFKTSEVEFKLSPIQSVSHNDIVSEVLDDNETLLSRLDDSVVEKKPEFVGVETPMGKIFVAPGTAEFANGPNTLTPNSVELADEDLLFWSSGSESNKKSA